MTCSSSCGSSSASNAATGTAGRQTQMPPRNYWPDHEQRVLTNFVSERNRVATMWKL